jgi:hypothetical protein
VYTVGYSHFAYPDSRRRNMVTGHKSVIPFRWVVWYNSPDGKKLGVKYFKNSERSKRFEYEDVLCKQYNCGAHTYEY